MSSNSLLNEVKNFNTGNFITINHVEKAFELVKVQLENENFSFKTIELEIYRKEDRLNKFNCDDYYKEYIQKDLFYNEFEKFYSVEYIIPKGLYGVREFDFLSFELLILYYSLGFYIYDLIKESYDTIEEKKSKKSKINTYYGGKINFNTPKNTSLFYHDDFISFNKSVNDNIERILNSNKKAIVIKLDIQNFFKSIDLKKLIEIFSKYAVPSNTKRNKFDYSTREEINNLLLFISKKDKGLPLFSQNIISNFLSYFYLFELDNFIQELGVYHNESFVYSRYVDDFYMTFQKNKGTSNDKIGDEIFDITTSITEFLAKELGLKINNLKTQTLIIENNDDFKKFIDNEKNISLPKLIKENKSFDEKLKEIETIIYSLKKQYKAEGTAYIDSENSNKLKEIFSKSFQDYLKSKKAKFVIDKMFVKWNPILTHTNTQSLLFLIKHSSSNELLKEYLLKNFRIKSNNPHFLFLLEKFILSNGTDTQITTLLERTKERSNYSKLISRMIGIDTTIDINNKKIEIGSKLLVSEDALMQQIKMLCISEIEGKYNLAFNHLLNIYHLYCFLNDERRPTKLKDYNQINVSNFIDDLGLSNDILNFTIHFFDRRNKNNISHPGEKLMENWVVTQPEFEKYKSKMNIYLKKMDIALLL